MSLRSENARAEAKKLLCHYFNSAFERSGLVWEEGNDFEIGMIVDLLIEATQGTAADGMRPAGLPSRAATRVLHG